jgi:hypothetical protein
MKKLRESQCVVFFKKSLMTTVRESLLSLSIVGDAINIRLLKSKNLTVKIAFYVRIV